MKEFKMDILYLEDVVIWDCVRLPMQKIQNGKWTDLNSMNEKYPEAIKEQSIRLGKILYSNY